MKFIKKSGSKLNRASCGRFHVLITLLSLIFISQSVIAAKITKKQWGSIEEKPVWLYTLENQKGMKVKVTNWGAYTVSIITQDKHGNFADVILGYDTFEQYHQDCCYNGAIVGRYANRIAKGQFSINNKQYQLTTNNGGPEKINHNHGGNVGFNKRLWQSRIINNTIEMSYLSPDGEQGYPGNLEVKLTYSLSEENELKLTFFATTDKTTPINLISHAYYNLSGTNKNIEQHKLTINADYMTEAGEYLIPTGKFLSVDKSPFDFRQAKAIGRDIRQVNTQLTRAGGQDKAHGGYDHNWVLNNFTGQLQQVARLVEPQSGREMLISTTQPGLHLYTGNFMNGSVVGKNSDVMNFRSGVALETQHFPDSPNQNNFPSTLLTPEKVYKQITTYRFTSK
tara:strand:- start:105 stop:1289 length:1185 start_codon:yes stop_codon:yes gene_type:complete